MNPRNYKLVQARILMIDSKLRSGSYLSASAMAREYEVSTKTIQRDLDYMRDNLGAPLDFDKSRKGWYYTEPNFYLPALDISESDFFAICVTEKALRLYENTPIYSRLQSIFDKMKVFLPDNIRISTAWIDTRYTFLQESTTTINPTIWDTISHGLRLKRCVRIGHRKAGGTEATHRSVDPYHIINYRGEWYLIGRCHMKGDIRRFAISRIEEAEMQIESFTIPKDFDFNTYINGSFGIMTEDKEYTIRVRFSKEQAPYVLERQWHAQQEILEHENGTVTLSFPATSLFEVKRWVLSWGSDAEVIEPAELKNMIQETVSRMAKIYA